MYNNTAYFNGSQGFWFGSFNKPNMLINNISYNNNDYCYLTTESTVITSNFLVNNTVNSAYTVTDADFVSLDQTQLLNARKIDGSLPDITFLHLASTSDLVNAGTVIDGIPYVGSAPDIGAFENSILLTIEGTVINNTEVGTWIGVNIARNDTTTFIYKNNSITSVNSAGYVLQAGDEQVDSNNNNLKAEVITGNKFIWNGADTNSITHGIFTGYNTDAIIKYNYIEKVPMGIVRKSNGMTNISGGVAYNIINNPLKAGVVVKGMKNVNIYNNTFYSEHTIAETWRGLVDIYSNDSPYGLTSGTKIFNNIFYTKNQILNINVYDSENLIDFESDYNVFYCESGTPIFKIGSVIKTFAQWQALGYDLHSVIINPNFTNFIDFIPSTKLSYGTNLGSIWETGLSIDAIWSTNDPATTIQNGTWQVGSIIYP
jgi:hypothetical protein